MVGSRILRELGIAFSGGIPQPSGYAAVLGDTVHSLPTNFASLVATDLLPLSARFEYARALVALARMDAADLMGVSVKAWLDEMGLRPEVRAVIESLVRLVTYVHAPERLSAGAAIHQLRGAHDAGVYYLDGGGGALVNELVSVAKRSGLLLRCGARASRVTHDHGEVRGVVLQDGGSVHAPDVIVAAGPRARASRHTPARTPTWRGHSPDRAASATCAESEPTGMAGGGWARRWSAALPLAGERS